MAPSTIRRIRRLLADSAPNGWTLRTYLKRVLMWLHGHCYLPDRVLTLSFRVFGLARA